MSSNSNTNSKSKQTSALDYQARISDKIARENASRTGSTDSRHNSTSSGKNSSAVATGTIGGSSVSSSVQSAASGTSRTSAAARTPSARLADKISRDNKSSVGNSAGASGGTSNRLSGASEDAPSTSDASSTSDRARRTMMSSPSVRLAEKISRDNNSSSANAGGNRVLSSPSMRLAQKIASDSATTTSSTNTASRLKDIDSSDTQNNEQNHNKRSDVISTTSSRLAAKINNSSGVVAEDNDIKKEQNSTHVKNGNGNEDEEDKNVIEISDHDRSGAAATAIGAIAVGGTAATSTEESMSNQPNDGDDTIISNNDSINDGPPLIEATLVQSEKMAVDEEAAVVMAQVVEERRVCGVNIADRGVKRCMFLVVGIVVVAAIIVGVVVGKSSNSSPPANAGDDSPSEESTAAGWDMLGEQEDMIGAGGGMFGTSVSLSSDGTRVAVAFGREQGGCDSFRSRQLKEGRDGKAGRRAACWLDITAAEVYDFFPDVGEYGAWMQLSGDIWTENWRWEEDYGDATNVAISLSGDGNKLGVLTMSGVRMFSIELEDSLDENYTLLEDVVPLDTSVNPDYTAFKISLSEDGTRVAISESGLFWNSTETTVGRVRAVRDIVEYDNVQIIQPTVEENYTDFGEAMTMSSSGSTIAFGASRAWPFEPTGEDYEYVFIYKLSAETNSWVRAASIFGLKEAFLLGPESIALSYDGDTIAIGTSGWDEQPRACVPGSCTDSGGRIRTYRRNMDSGQYEQFGTDIFGEPPQFLGTSLDLSDGGKMLVAGGPLGDGGGVASGVVVTYSFNGTDWEPLGGEDSYFTNGSPGERIGTSVSLGGDGRTVAVGAPTSQVGGPESGAAFVFEFSDAS